MCIMKISLRKFLFALVFSLVTIYTNAEDFFNFNTVSAQVADIFRYGEFGTSLFTGRMQQTIPIYTLDDPDFKMNIALHYNAEGFKSRKHSGPVGYNWFLEAGGCITREVNGFPDEIFRYRSPFHEEGMYHFVTRVNDIDKNDVFELPYDTLGTLCITGIFPVHMVGNNCLYDVDYEPDIFHFDFLGYKGTFMINNEGKVQIVNGDYVEVDLSGILENEYMPISANDILPFPHNGNSAITIKTTDGYTYIFGGDFSKLEYTVDIYRDGNGMKSFSPYVEDVYVFKPNVSTWYLAKIIAPNNRTVTFNYMPSNIRSLPEDAPAGDSPLWEFNENYNRLAPYYSVLSNYYNHTQFPDNCIDAFNYPAGTGSYYIRSATKTCRIRSIEVSGEQPLRIVFDNVQELLRMYAQSSYYGNTPSMSPSKNNYQLNTIRVLSSDRIIKTVSLTYVYKSFINSVGGYSFNWRFLNSVDISGVGTYRMEYYDGSFPDLLYLSGLSNGNSLIENNEMDEYGYYVGDSPNMALLKKMTYPTGGWQTYEYEAYSYAKKRKYKVVNEDELEMLDVEESGSKRGARIKEVKTYNDSNHLVETRNYIYSEGVYYDNLKVYNFPERFPEDGWPIAFMANYGMLDSHIGYGNVTEEVTNAQGTYTTIHRFDLGENTYSSANDSDLNGRYFCDNQKFGIMSGLMFYRSKIRKWGKQIAIENYDSNNRLLKSTHYKYNDIPDSSMQMCLDTIVIFSHYMFSDVSKKLYLFPDVLTEEVTKDYNQEDSLVATKLYSYDNRLRIKKEITEDSHNIQYFTKYRYPDDIPGADELHGFPSPLFMLINDKRISVPVETISGYIQNETEYVTSGTINLYANNTYGESISPDIGGLHILPYLHQTHSLALSEPITNYQLMDMSDSQVSYDQRYRLTCEYNFDLMYRPISIKPFGAIETKYTWDGIYPVTKTIGNRTWSYTHIPHVGVNSITDPRGITTYYTYDAAGRLIEEYQLVNGAKQILNAYHYHIKTE